MNSQTGSTVFADQPHKMLDDFGNVTVGVKCKRGHWHPVPVPWEICQCGYLPQEDRDFCTKHGTKAKPQPQPEPKPQPQPRRVISVGRTRPLHDASSGDAILDKIEGIVGQATVDGELTRRQLGALRWALGKCRSITTELREDFDSL